MNTVCLGKTSTQNFVVGSGGCGGVCVYVCVCVCVFSSQINSNIILVGLVRTKNILI